MLSDVELMLKVREGQTDKLGLLFERYNKSLFSYFYRYCGRQDVSEDLVQNVFYRILKYRKDYNGSGKFTTWMYKIAHNLAIDYYRKHGRYLYHDVDRLVDEYEDTADKALIKKEEIRLLQQALDQLKPHEREVLILSKYQELTYKEIGSILNSPEGTIKARLFRAIQSLKEIYGVLER